MIPNRLAPEHWQIESALNSHPRSPSESATKAEDFARKFHLPVAEAATQLSQEIESSFGPARAVELQLSREDLSAIGWEEGEQVLFEQHSSTSITIANKNNPSKRLTIVQVLGLPA